MPKKTVEWGHGLEEQGLAKPGHPTGPPAGHPPESLANYSDASWELVDAPHDMLINQVR